MSELLNNKLISTFPSAIAKLHLWKMYEKSQYSIKTQSFAWRQMCAHLWGRSVTKDLVCIENEWKKCEFSENLANTRKVGSIGLQL